MSAAERATTALLELMARLRDPERGCPWDRQQTFKSIAPCTLEEAYEVIDAIDRGDPGHLRDELGDLLFQIVFHSQLAAELGWFDFAAVATGIHEKLVRRHPHVFAGAALESPEAHSRTWELLKAQERSKLADSGSSADTSALAGVPKALPALVRAVKLGRRAARVGFDWESPDQVRDKVLEELQEVDVALAGASDPAARSSLAEEIGDLLFAVANWSLHLKIDPEEALRAANAKFELRFRAMEALAAERGAALETLSAADWEALWGQAKRATGP